MNNNKMFINTPIHGVCRIISIQFHAHGTTVTYVPHDGVYTQYCITFDSAKEAFDRINLTDVF